LAKALSSGWATTRSAGKKGVFGFVLGPIKGGFIAIVEGPYISSLLHTLEGQNGRSYLRRTRRELGEEAEW
jgi:hypothetical protein